MKTALCISGIPRGTVKQNVDTALKHFDADVFYATYTNQEEQVKKHTDTYYLHAEPSISYHPLADIPEDVMPPVAKTWALREQIKSDFMLYERMRHQSKQIFAHDMLLNEISAEYDMIVRMRYDTRLSTVADLKPYLQKSYNENIAIGFGTRTRRHKNFDTIEMVPKIWPNRRGSTPGVSNDWGGYIMDPLILHPRKLWDSTRLKELHAKKSLLSAERGFYQILSQPYGDSHECYYGGAQIEKYLSSTNYV